MEAYRGSAALLMTTDLIVADRPQDAEIGPLAAIADRASEFIHNSKARNTVRAYRADWCHFDGWCKAHGQSSLPASPDCVALYLTDLSASHKPATLTRRISAVSQAHQIATRTGSLATCAVPKVRRIPCITSRTLAALVGDSIPAI
jgi:hypothetical protein